MKTKVELIHKLSNEGLEVEINDVDDASANDLIFNGRQMEFSTQLPHSIKNFFTPGEVANEKTTIPGYRTNCCANANICWWCRESIPAHMNVSGIPMRIYRDQSNTVLETFGNFCSEMCMLSFCIYARYNNKVATNIRWLYRIRTGNNDLRPVPHFTYHKNWGGDMNDDQFRKVIFEDNSTSVGVNIKDNLRKIGCHHFSIKVYQDVQF